MTQLVLVCVGMAWAFGVPETDPTIRPVVCLNGEWQFQPADAELTFPPSSHWDPTPIRIPSPWNVNGFSKGDGGDFRCFPSYPEGWEKVRCAWHRRTFSVPADWRGKRVVLRFEAVHYWADVYVNGRKCASHEGGFTPFEVDITDAVRFGAENELIVGVKDRRLFDVNGRTPYGWGSFWGEWILGIWQDVYLLARPPLHLSNPFIRTTLEGRRLRIEAEVVNATIAPACVGFDAIVYPWADGRWRHVRPALRLKAVEVEVPAGGSRRVVVEAAWPDVKLWWPHNPQLYVACLHLFALARSQIHDELPVRFGFREFKIGPDGRKFTLNGRTWTGRGDAWHFMGIPQMTPDFARAWYSMAQGININIIRLHAQVYPEYYLDVADEMGMLIVDETALWGSAGNFYYDEGFRRRAVEHVRELVLRDRNHPSVVLWSVGNEVAWMSPSAAGVKSQDEIFQLFADLAAEMKRLDPTREVSCDGDGDLGGRLPIFSLHYPGPNPPNVKAKVFTIGESGQMFYSEPRLCAYRLGDRVYLSNNDRLEAVGLEMADLIEGYRRWAAYATVFNVQWYGLQPLPMECRFTYDRLDTPGVKPERIGPYSTGLNAGRDPDLPPFIPNPVYRHVADAFEPLRFFIVERGVSAYVPDQFVRHVAVHNDTMDDAALELRWTLATKAQAIARTSAKLRLAAGDWKEVELRLLLPALDRPTPAESTMELISSGRSAYTDRRTLYLYPRADAREYAKPVAVIGGPQAEAIAASLGSGARPLSDVAALDSWLGDRVDAVTVIAPDARLAAKDRDRLNTWLAQGLAILDLTGGEVFEVGGLPLGKAGGDGYRLAFAKNPRHPLLEGLAPEQLCYWAPDGLVAGRGFWGTPPMNMTPLVTAGDGDSVMAEAIVGRGRAIVSSLRLAEALSVEPAAAMILRNAVSYLAAARPAEWRTAAAIPGDDVGARMALWSLGLWDLDSAKSPSRPSGSPQVLVVAGAALSEAVVADAKRCLDAGGTVLVINPSPDCAQAIGEITHATVTMTPTDLCQLVPLRGHEDDPLLAGLDLSDLCWLGEKDGEVILPWALVVANPLAQPRLVSNRTDWRRWVYRGENLKPGAIQRCEDEPYQRRVGLVRVPTEQGAGQVVICGVPVLPVNAKSMRVFGQLLTNLGVSWRRRAISDQQRAEFYLRATGTIVQWLMLGPIRGKSWAELYADDLIGGEASARPVVGGMAGGAAWVPRQTSPVVNLSDRDWYGTLPDAAMYFAAYVRSPVARKALLLVGSDDDVKLWLNGALVHAAQVARPVAPDQDRVGPVELRAGWNILLAKVVNRTGNWGFCLRVVDENGRPLPDLSLAVDDPEANFVEVSPDGWQATSQPPGDVAAAWDRRPGTRWTSGRPMDDTMQFILDLGDIRTVRRVILDTSGSPGDWPRGLCIEASADGRDWQVVVDAPDASAMQQGGVTCVTFAPTPARFLRFRQTGPAGCSGGLYWSIHELRVFQ